MLVPFLQVLETPRVHKLKGKLEIIDLENANDAYNNVLIGFI